MAAPYLLITTATASFPKAPLIEFFENENQNAGK